MKHESILSKKIQKEGQTAFKSKEDYEKQLKALQIRMLDIQQLIRHKKKKVIVIFEGADASGKGGIIKRMTELLDPRVIRVHATAAPNEIERQQNYLERFFKLLPEPGTIAIFDRSWYGRVLVERVEGIISKKDWHRAYNEIKAVEEMLSADGVLILKFCLDVSFAEQETRFKDRENDPLKKWKLTAEDWRNRKKWNKYLPAFTDMIQYTSTKAAPWTVVASDSKWFARVEVLRDIQRQIKRRY